MQHEGQQPLEPHYPIEKREESETRSEHEPYACVTFKNDTGKIVRGEVMPLTAAKERLARLAVEDPEGRYVLEVMLPDGETDAALPAGE